MLLINSRDLSRNDTAGQLSPEIFGLNHFLSHNSICGTLPSSNGNLTRLKRLTLNGNKLNGSIPEELSNLLNADNTALHSNDFSGPFPVLLGKMGKLARGTLGGNLFQGAVPDQIGRLKRYRRPFDLNATTLTYARVQLRG